MRPIGDAFDTFQMSAKPCLHGKQLTSFAQRWALSTNGLHKVPLLTRRIVGGSLVLLRQEPDQRHCSKHFRATLGIWNRYLKENATAKLWCSSRWRYLDVLSKNVTPLGTAAVAPKSDRVDQGHVGPLGLRRG